MGFSLPGIQRETSPPHRRGFWRHPRPARWCKTHRPEVHRTTCCTEFGSDRTWQHFILAQTRRKTALRTFEPSARAPSTPLAQNPPPWHLFKSDGLLGARPSKWRPVSGQSDSLPEEYPPPLKCQSPVAEHATSPPFLVLISLQISRIICSGEASPGP